MCRVQQCLDFLRCVEVVKLVPRMSDSSEVGQVRPRVSRKSVLKRVKEKWLMPPLFCSVADTASLGVFSI